MAEEPAAEEQQQPEVIVEVAGDADNKLGKPQLTDDEVSKLADVPDDEVSRYAKDAQKRIKSLKVVNQEWKRRVIQSNKDMATATTLAQQLYNENQQLRANVGRSEEALINQAIQRAEAQLEQAKSRARLAYSASDPDAIVAANEEVSRYVAETDRLRLLKPTTPAAAAAAPEEERPAAPAQSPGVQAWMQRNPWFNAPGNEEITGFALGVHADLAKQGITEASNPDQYWSSIDRRLREVYPQRFKTAVPAAPAESEQQSEQEPAEQPVRRPVAVMGGTRVNGSAPVRPRHVTLTDSQVRIARSLGLTPEQYAQQLVKDSMKDGRVQ
jgi:hypothetical protein